MENHTNPKDPNPLENESPKISQTTESVNPIPTSQDQAKATSQEKGLLQRIEDCPSDRVRDVLLDSLNKENNTAESDG